MTDFGRSALTVDMASQPPSKPPNPALIELAQPEKLSAVLKDDKHDCLACRLTGRTSFMDPSQQSTHEHAW